MRNLSNFEQIIVPLPDGDTEAIWAEQVEENLFRLANSPFFAYGLSWRDIVETRAINGSRKYVRTVEKSGHRTVRIYFEKSLFLERRARALLRALEVEGCNWDNLDGRFVAVNVPPVVDLSDVCALLDEYEVDWEHADPTYDELYSNGSNGAAN